MSERHEAERKLSNGPGEKPEIFGKVGVCWRRSCDEAFRRYWRLRLREVLPYFSDLNGSVIEIGVTDGPAHIIHKNSYNDRQVVRLNPPPSVLVDRNEDFFVLAHELTHWIHDEQFTDLFALAHAPRTRDIGFKVRVACGYFPKAMALANMGLGDVIADLAAMSLHHQGNRQLWFDSRVNELQIEAEIVEALPKGDAA